MKKILVSIVSIAILCSINVPVFAQTTKEDTVKKEVNKIVEQHKNVSEVVDMVNQSVVAIIGKNTQTKEDEYIYSKFPKNLQSGSGVLVTDQGRIITNNHVVEGLDEIYVVTYDGKVYKAELLYADKDIDLALLKINRSNLKAMKLGDEKEIKVGDEVIAIGTPLFFGYRNSATKGIISGLNRPVDTTYTYLQTDAAINPGNSGGPLVNNKGELVGINTLGNLFYQGISFSIPVDNVKYFLNHYNLYGKIKKCYIGIDFEENWAALLGIPTNQGLKVITLKKDAVVNSKQVKEGDILEEIDGKRVTSIAEYNEILKNHLPNDKVKLTFNRNNKKFDIMVTLKEKPEINK